MKDQEFTNKLEKLEKLKKLMREVPKIRKDLEAIFPQLIDTEPYVFSNNPIVFVRKEYPKNLYSFIYMDGKFRVVNLNSGKIWPTSCDPSGHRITMGLFLTRTDFESMFRRAACSLTNLKFLDLADVIEIHNAKFDKR